MPSETQRAHYQQLLQRCAALPTLDAAVAHPCEAGALASALEAAQLGLIRPILIGPSERIHATAEQADLDISTLELLDVEHSHAAAERAAHMAGSGEVAMLIKGSLHTDELMAEVVRRDANLRTERRISHAFVLDVPTLSQPLIVSDAAINILPDLNDKRDITQNAIELAHALGIACPRVAILSATETVTSKVPSTIEAAALCKMAERGQITGAILDGPLALDNAVDLGAARLKHIESPVAGRADILIVPDLEAGNMLAKSLTFLAEAAAAGVVLGARVPIVLTSRADSQFTRTASCAVAVLLAAHLHNLRSPA